MDRSKELTELITKIVQEAPRDLAPGHGEGAKRRKDAVVKFLLIKKALLTENPEHLVHYNLTGNIPVFFSASKEHKINHGISKCVDCSYAKKQLSINEVFIGGDLIELTDINGALFPFYANSDKHYHGNGFDISLVNNKKTEDISISCCANCGTGVPASLLKKYGCIPCSFIAKKACVICGKAERINSPGMDVEITSISDTGGYYVHDSCSIPKDAKICASCKRKPLKGKTEIVCKGCEQTIFNEYNFKPAPSFFLSGGEKDKKSPYMGIEVEVEIRPNLRNIIARKDPAWRLLKTVNNAEPLNKNFIYLKNDSSISERRNNDRYFGGFEIVSHPGSMEFWHSNLLANFWGGLSTLAKVAQSYSSGNCGVHVHISRTGFEHNGLHEAAFGWFIENRLYFVSIVAERSNKKYSKTGMNNWKQIVILRGAYLSPDHHSMVSYTNHTIEVRPFRGNLRKERILKDIEFTWAVYEWTKGLKLKDISEFEETLTVEAFMKYIETDEKFSNLKSYLDSQMNKFFMNTPANVKKIKEDDAENRKSIIISSIRMREMVDRWGYGFFQDIFAQTPTMRNQRLVAYYNDLYGTNHLVNSEVIFEGHHDLFPRIEQRATFRAPAQPMARLAGNDEPPLPEREDREENLVEVAAEMAANRWIEENPIDDVLDRTFQAIDQAGTGGDPFIAPGGGLGDNPAPINANLAVRLQTLRMSQPGSRATLTYLALNNRAINGLLEFTEEYERSRRGMVTTSIAEIEAAAPVYLSGTDYQVFRAIDRIPTRTENPDTRWAEVRGQPITNGQTITFEVTR